MNELTTYHATDRRVYSETEGRGLRRSDGREKGMKLKLTAALLLLLLLASGCAPQCTLRSGHVWDAWVRNPETSEQHRKCSACGWTETRM